MVSVFVYFITCVCHYPVKRGHFQVHAQMTEQPYRFPRLHNLPRLATTRSASTLRTTTKPPTGVLLPWTVRSSAVTVHLKAVVRIRKDY